MATVARIVPLGSILRGDKWNGMTVTFNQTGHDFTGTTALVHIRQDPDGDILYTPSLNVAYPATGQMTVSFSVPGATTATFPKGTVYGDVQLERTSPAWGPFTWFRFSLAVQLDVTYG